MKALALALGLLLAISMAAAQSKTPAQDPDFINLTTPMVLEKSKSFASLNLNYFGDPGDLVYSGIGYGYGIGNGWEFDIRGDFSSFKSHGLGPTSVIRYGGSDGEALLKYKLPSSFDLSVEGGLIYAATPAQPHRLEGVAGISAGYGLSEGVRVYINPKVVSLEGEPLLGIGLGAVVDIAPGYQGFGEWTPLLDGRNTVSTSAGGLQRVQLYGIGIRFTKIAPGLLIDLAYTNSAGETDGFGLTPSLGNVGGVQLGLTYRF